MGRRSIGRGFRGGRPDRKMLLLAAVAAVLLLYLIWSGVSWLRSEMPYWGRQPSEIVTAALDDIKTASSYIYTLETALTEGGQETRLAVFSGAKSGRDARVVGELTFLKTTVEVIRKEDKLYRKDYSDSRWVELPLLSLESLDKLMVEMEPLTIFSFADLAEAKYAGKEKVDGVKCRVYEIMTRGEHPWLIDYWEDFTYRLWVDQQTGQLVRGEIRADQPGNGARGIVVRLSLGDVGKEITIEAPSEP